MIETIGVEDQKRAVDALEGDGAVILRGAFDPESILRLSRAWFSDYGGIGQGELDETCIRVGPDRYMVSVDIREPFDDADLYARPTVMAILHAVLSERVVINSFAAVVAYPGAGEQHPHTDHPPLYEPEVAAGLPPHAVTLVVPLVALSELTGGTRVWVGSHRRDRSACEEHILLPQVGDCALVDYRVWHGGTPNRANVPRPILYVVYSRPWFRDSVNFYKQAPIRIGPAALAAVPEEARPLFGLVEPAWLRGGKP